MKKKVSNLIHRPLADRKSVKLSSTGNKIMDKKVFHLVDVPLKNREEIKIKIRKKKEKEITKGKNLIKRWWFGMGKEIKRLSCKSKKELFYDFIVVIIVCLILGIILFCIDLIIIRTH